MQHAFRCKKIEQLSNVFTIDCVDFVVELGHGCTVTSSKHVARNAHASSR